MKHSPLETTFWQFSNIVPIVVSLFITVAGAIFTYEAFKTDVVRRLDRVEQKMDFLGQQFQEFKTDQTSKRNEMTTYVSKIVNMETCARQVCTWYK